MAVRTAQAGTWAVGAVLAAADLNKLPGGWIGYNEATVDQTGLAAGVDLTSLSVGVTVGTSRRIKITGFALLEGSSATDLARLDIREGATVLNVDQQQLLSGASRGFKVESILTPSAGSHTYKLLAIRTSGAGTLTLRAASTNPAFVLVEDLGPAS